MIARQIGKILATKEPKVVNGPEILNKFVGASEENIRNLFKEAEEDTLANGDNAELHIIIFDEIDASQLFKSSRCTNLTQCVVNEHTAYVVYIRMKSLIICVLNVVLCICILFVCIYSL